MANTSNPQREGAAMNTSFDKFSEEYENMAGRITRQFIPRILAVMPPINADSVFHDEGCGPAIATQVVTETSAKGPPGAMVCTDVAPGMVKAAEACGKARGWQNTEYLVRDASNLEGIDSDKFTHTICNFVLFAVPDKKKAVEEAFRTTKSGGYVVFTTWKHAGTMRVLHRAQHAIRPDLPLFFSNADCEIQGDEDGTKDVPRYRAWMEETFGKGNLEVKAMDYDFECTHDEMMRAFSSPFWSPAKAGYTEEDLAKWDSAIEKAILPEDKQRAAVTMDAWCFILKKE